MGRLVAGLACVSACIATLISSPAVSAAPAKERCGSPLKAGGQPALVAIVMDGISSAEPNSGTSQPLKIRNWCPARPDGSERHMPPGIEDGYRTWAGLATANGQHPQTTTCRPKGGLNTNACLVARLADAGAIVLPYSYTGAEVSRSGALHLYRVRRPGHLPASRHLHCQPRPIDPVDCDRVALGAGRHRWALLWRDRRKWLVGDARARCHCAGPAHLHAGFAAQRRCAVRRDRGSLFTGGRC